MPRNDLIQVRSDTATNWASVNPILVVGEQGFETDTGKFKIGTGSTTWNSLLYATDASDITGTTLASNVTGSSLTSVGTLSSLAVTNDITRGGVSMPRGIMQLATSVTPPANVTATEVVQLTATFTAVANRYYKITYYEPDIGLSGFGAVTVSMRIRNGTTIAGTQLQIGYQYIASSSVDQQGQVVYFGTFSATTQNIVGTLQASAVNAIIGRSAGKAAYLVVEDIGAV